MKRKPRIAIVGPGRLGTTIALALSKVGFQVSEVVSRQGAPSRRRGARLARRVAARAVSLVKLELTAEIVWLCVPDREIRRCAAELARKVEWNGKIAFHSSGALTSSELEPLRRRGANVASVHPLMTFVAGVEPRLDGVVFAVEGDAGAIRAAQRIVGKLGGETFEISKAAKPAYHAWGAFTSPLLVAALVTGERVAALAGMNSKVARQRMLPIVLQTITNYVMRGPAGAFSGPIVRGDTQTVAKHLEILKKVPTARDVYVALAKAAIKNLPSGSRKALEKMLRSAGKPQ